MKLDDKRIALNHNTFSLVPSTPATCFSHSDRQQTFKHVIFKTQNKMHLY
jgi:hypothetical protein